MRTEAYLLAAKDAMILSLSEKLFICSVALSRCAERGRPMMDDCQEDEAKYDQSVRHILAVAEPFLTKFYGKCPDYDPECEGCKRWKALAIVVGQPGDNAELYVAEGRP